MGHWENASVDVRQGRLSMGYYGHVYLDDTLLSFPITDDLFCAIEAFGDDANITYDVHTPRKNDGSTYTVTLKEGVRVYGRLSNLTVNTGEVIAYYW
jgi:hypothetical protein